jgi:hypothetical protein
MIKCLYCQKKGISRQKLLITLMLTIISTGAMAESVYVKYRGEVDLTPFTCEWVSRSSVLKRLCYDHKEQYVECQHYFVPRHISI